MPTPKVTGKFSSTNDYSMFTKDNTNITLLTAATSLNKNFKFSFGVGNYWTVDAGKHKNVPALELKASNNFGKYMNAAVRYRRLGGTNQYRVIFGANYDINKHHSLSAETYFTMKQSDKWSKGTGISVGYTYAFNNGVELSTELEQGIPLNSDSPSIGRTLGSFSDSEKTFNVKLSVPIFKNK